METPDLTPAQQERALLLERIAAVELLAAQADQDREEAVSELRGLLSSPDPVEAPIKARILSKLLDTAQSRVTEARRELRALREDLRRCEPGAADAKEYLASVYRGDLPSTTSEKLNAARLHLSMGAGQDEEWEPCPDW